MGTHTGGTDHINRVRLEPEITRAYWSTRRTWNDARVTLVVETRWVPDGTPVKIAVWESDEGEGSPDDAIDSLEGHAVTNGRCVIEYDLRWDAAMLGDEAEREGGELEFYFVATIERFRLTKRSPLLYVDLPTYRVSS